MGDQNHQPLLIADAEKRKEAIDSMAKSRADCIGALSMYFLSQLNIYNTIHSEASDDCAINWMALFLALATGVASLAILKFVLYSMNTARSTIRNLEMPEQEIRDFGRATVRDEEGHRKVVIWCSLLGLTTPMLVNVLAACKVLCKNKT